jgi:hypothetical protein
MDSLFGRMGDGIAAISTQSFIVWNVVLVYIRIAFIVVREHRLMSKYKRIKPRI